MCGIVGYVGHQAALPVLLEGLQSLEYRGYDSAGVALPEPRHPDEPGQPSLQVVRRAGKVAELAAAAAGSSNGQHAGIGHTRWATCGEPSEANAHPHRDCTGRVAIVHNGIIENHLQLRRELEAQGHTFTSATDSEVVAHLVERHLAQGADFLEAVRRSVGQLHGSYAVVAIDAATPGTIVGARMDAPLVLGVGEGEYLLASDVAPLLAYTRRVVWLADGEIAQVRSGPRGGVRLIGADGAEHVPAPSEISWDRAAAEKAGFPDFMLKEIHEQPRALRDTLRGRCEPSGELTLSELTLDPARVDGIDKIFIVACGSSYHAGLVAKYAFERWARIPVEIDVASEFRYRDPVLNDRTLVVGISQSGETADTLAAIRYARRQGAAAVVITNVVGSSLSREADAVLYTHAGPEIGVAATKTLVTQIAALWLLGLWLARTIGALPEEEARQVVQDLWRCPEQMEDILAAGLPIPELAERFAGAPGWLFIGRGVGYPLALEGALKLKEISYLHAEGFAAGEMKHGPIALIDKGVPVVAIATHSKVLGKLISNVEEARARGASIIAIAQQGDERVLQVAGDVLVVPQTAELLSPMLDLLPLQLLAYHVAKHRGLDPDRPRNLAKSVTVE